MKPSDRSGKKMKNFEYSKPAGTSTILLTFLIGDLFQNFSALHDTSNMLQPVFLLP